jgi:hypothetical protein
MPNAAYAGPFYGPSDAGGRGPDRSPYIKGYKRGLSRAGYMKWANFDEQFNRTLEKANAAMQRDHPKAFPKATGQIGQGSHNVMEKLRSKKGKPALDKVALMLMEDGYDIKHPPVVETPEDKVRDSITEYLQRCEDNRWSIHYLQQRPCRSFGRIPESGYSGDCSELAIAAYYWARQHSGVHVPDPSGYSFTGYGNSDTLYQFNRSRKVGMQSGFLVGDIAIYGPSYRTKHVTICKRAGDLSSAHFTSHGSEVGPYPSTLLYRSDLLAVVRPRLRVIYR